MAVGAGPSSTGFLPKGIKPKPVVQTLAVFLLMAILTQAFFTLVSGNFVTFTFFSARHTAAN